MTIMMLTLLMVATAMAIAMPITKNVLMKTTMVIKAAGRVDMCDSLGLDADEQNHKSE